MKIKIRIKLFCTGVIYVLFLTMIGCGNPRVTGNVTFSDGTPLSKGQVVFEDEKNTYIGKIQPNGAFRMGVLKDGEGIPSGKYKVAIYGANDEEIVDPEAAPVVTPLIAPQFRSTKTSGIEYDISKSIKIAIVVEKP
jgi:hypothetical protein